MSEVNVVDEVTPALRSLGLVGGAPSSILLRINDFEVVVTLVPPDVEQPDAFDLRFRGSAELCEAARSVQRQETPQDLWIREGRIVRRVAASPYTVPRRPWTAPLRLFAAGLGKLFGKPT
jgi:hypothetical protein